MKNMKKRNVFLVSLLIVAGSLLLMSQQAWDKNTPKEESATLYFDDQITVWGIDGETKSLGPISKGFKGKGTAKKPKAVMKIPAGQRTVNAQFSSWGAEDIKYNFVAGRNYQIKAETDASLIDTSNVGAAFGKSFVAAASGGKMADSGHKFVVTDITK